MTRQQADAVPSISVTEGLTGAATTTAGIVPEHWNEGGWNLDLSSFLSLFLSFSFLDRNGDIAFDSAGLFACSARVIFWLF